MRAHKLCRPPRGAGKIVRVLSGSRVVRKDPGVPAEAFLVEDAADEYSGTLYIVDCDCRPSEPKCPRLRMLTLAREGGLFESVSIVTRPARKA
jgi:hypothetical protein